MKIGDSRLGKQHKSVLPNFLIVGASRSGTSSLYYWLKQHPDVYMPNIKEPSFFVDEFGMSDWDEYLSLFETAGGKKARGEASVAYLESPESAQLIKEKLGNAKIIILLRNPVDRALSLYTWMAMHGHERLNTFQQAIAEEEKRFSDKLFRINNPVYFWSYMYVRNGLYYEQVKRYIEAFGNDLIRVYLFEDLVNLPGKLYRDVCEFLDISTNYCPVFMAKNASRLPKSITLQHYLGKVQKSLRGFSRGFRCIFSQTVPLIMALNTKLGYEASMPAELEKHLKYVYRKDIEKLSKLLGKDLSGWH